MFHCDSFFSCDKNVMNINRTVRSSSNDKVDSLITATEKLMNRYEGVE